MNLTAKFTDADNEKAYQIYLNDYAPAFDTAAQQLETLNDQIDAFGQSQSAQAVKMRQVALIVISTIIAATAVLTVLTLVKMTKAITRPIQQIQDAMQALADDSKYVGVYAKLRDMVYALMQMLGQIVEQVDATSAQVFHGSEQVANAAQALSQGASQQASSVQELAATLEQISKQVDENAQNIEGAKLDTLETVKELDTGKEKMQDEAIHQTTEGVNQISNVVQTNSATAQQTAAASEELSGQANVLRKLMSKFQLQTA